MYGHYKKAFGTQATASEENDPTDSEIQISLSYSFYQLAEEIYPCVYSITNVPDLFFRNICFATTMCQCM